MVPMVRDGESSFVELGNYRAYCFREVLHFKCTKRWARDMKSIASGAVSVFITIDSRVSRHPQKSNFFGMGDQKVSDSIYDPGLRIVDIFCSYEDREAVGANDIFPVVFQGKFYGMENCCRFSCKN